METPEHELDLLNLIANSDNTVHQRDLARSTGLSLGMINAIMKRLVHKGWLTIRKVNNRNIHYAVSPTGIEQITRRSYRYFKRTVKNIVRYRQAIEDFIREIKARGYGGILLIGVSDLGFLIEAACRTCGIEYVWDGRTVDAARRGEARLFTLYSETYVPTEGEKKPYQTTALLQDVVSRVSAFLME
jgi:predicted transcriptional regulator